MRRIFISYSRRDVDFVRRLAGDLENAGYEVWWDISNLRGGDDWVRVIPEAISASEFFTVVLSPSSIVSEWVRREYTLALHRHKKIIPLMLFPTTIPFSLNTLNYIDFTSEENYTASFINLLRALNYTGDLSMVPVSGVPNWMGRYGALITLVSFALLAAVAFFTLNLPLPATMIPTDLTPKPTSSLQGATAAGELTSHPIDSASVTPRSTVTETGTPNPTSTRTPAFQRLTFCVNSRSVNSINVRSGPGIIYARIGDPLPVGFCLDFRGQNEDGTWLLIAPAQTDPFLRQYEGGWIFRELLGLGSDGPIDLPAVTLTPTPTPTNIETSTP